MISTLTRFELHTGDASGQIWSESGLGVAIGQAVVVLELEESNGRVRCALVRNKTRRLRRRTAPSLHEFKG